MIMLFVYYVIQSINPPPPDASTTYVNKRLAKCKQTGNGIPIKASASSHLSHSSVIDENPSTPLIVTHIVHIGYVI